MPLYLVLSEELISRVSPYVSFLLVFLSILRHSSQLIRICTQGSAPPNLQLSLLVCHSLACVDYAYTYKYTYTYTYSYSYISTYTRRLRRPHIRDSRANLDLLHGLSEQQTGRLRLRHPQRVNGVRAAGVHGQPTSREFVLRACVFLVHGSVCL